VKVLYLCNENTSLPRLAEGANKLQRFSFLFEQGSPA
jgi:hypothetical protein